MTGPGSSPSRKGAAARKPAASKPAASKRAGSKGPIGPDAAPLHLRRWAEIVLCLVCLWAASYRTPAGALVRSLAARIVGVRTSARPLLAYYSAGVYAQRAPPQITLRGPVPPGQALAYGIAQLDKRTPAQIQRELARLQRALSSSEDAAVLAFFCGEEPSRFALQRALGEGDALDLESLSRQLPPRDESCIAQAAQAITIGTAFALAWPLPETVRVTSPFGPREHPTLGGARMHNGVDLGTPVETPVRAVAAGLVRRASSDDTNGKIVILDHGNGVETLYCHNDALLVASGDRVARGQVISRSGNTGRSTGPHLHYQLELGGHPVDPLRYRVSRAKIAAGGAD